MGKRGPQPRPEARKVAKGLRLSPGAWEKLARLAETTGTKQAEVIERLISDAPEPR